MQVEDGIRASDNGGWFRVMLPLLWTAMDGGRRRGVCPVQKGIAEVPTCDAWLKRHPNLDFYLTLFEFSSENWKRRARNRRPDVAAAALFALEVAEMHRNNVFV